jgi:PAS domain S-box-containing protein
LPVVAALLPVRVAFSAGLDSVLPCDCIRDVIPWLLMFAAMLILCGALWLRRHGRRSDQLLRASEARLRLSTEVAGVAVWEYDVEKDRMSCSANYDGLYGLEAQGDWTLDAFLKVMHPEGREPARRAIEAWMAPGGSEDETFDFRIIKPDQSIRWLSMTGEVVERNAEGAAVRVRGCLMDITDRRQADDAVKESERRLRTLLGNLPGLVYRCPNLAPWPFDFVSEGCLAVTGYLANELMGPERIAYGDLIHPDDRLRVWETVQAAVERDETFVLEYRIRDKKGRERWVRERGRAVTEGGAGVAVLEGFVMDITENKRAEEALRAEESQSRLMADLVMDSDQPVAVGFADGRLDRFNPAFCELTGYTQEELQAIDWANELTPPEWLPAEREALAGLERTGTPVRYEKEYIRKDATRVPVELFVHLTRDANGNTDYHYAFITDIAERKRQQGRLQMVNDALENSLNAFDIIAANGLFTYVNRSYVELWGYDCAEEIIGTSPAEHYLDPEQPAKIISALQTSGVFEGEVTAKRKDGSTFEALMIARRSYDSSGRVIYPSSSIDITQRKQAEERLKDTHAQLERRVVERTAELKIRRDEAEDLNRAMINVLEDLKETNHGLEVAELALRTTNSELEAFSYSVSHDLRAPLRHIDGFVQLLLNREKDRLDDTSARYLQTIAGSSRRMGHLIDDLLSFSRTGRAEMHLRAVESGDVVRDVIGELAHLTAGRNIEWHIGDLPRVQADKGLLRLVWQNLIGNAIKYTGTREEARIEIGATTAGCDPADGEITFFIRDNGVGFDSTYQHKLFGVFQRLHRDDEFEGTGIGLATVRRIIHRHGGRVWAEGQVNQGASFFFTLNTSEGVM